MSRTLVFAAVLIWASWIAGGVFAQPTITDTSYAVTAHDVGGFTNPTGIDFLGHNPEDFFVIEKNTGRVRRHLNGINSIALDLQVEIGRAHV